MGGWVATCRGVMKTPPHFICVDASLVDSTRPEYGERLSPRKSPSELIARVAHELYYRFGSVAEVSEWGVG